MHAVVWCPHIYLHAQGVDYLGAQQLLCLLVILHISFGPWPQQYRIQNRAERKQTAERKEKKRNESG